MAEYSTDKFVQEAQSIQPRFIDTWLLPGIVMYLAWASKGVSRWPRRVAFSAGIYMIYRNLGEYQKIIQGVTTNATPPQA